MTSAPDVPRPAGPEVQQAVEHFGGALVTAGFPPLPARVFAALMATEQGRLTSAELASLLEVSPAGVSGAVRYLSQVGMIRRERERGSRRDVYVVRDDAWHDVLMQSGQVYGPIVAALTEVIGTLEPDTQAAARMQLSVEFLEFIQAEMRGIATRWEEYKASR